jgi:hypothetical protein
MRRVDEPIEPEIAASLDAIDATLAGEPVDPEYAELAELAVLLAAERPQPRAPFASSLDERVDARFVTRRHATRPRRRSSAWLWGGGMASALAASIAVVVVLSSGGTSRLPHRESSVGTTAAGPAVRSTASGATIDGNQSSPAPAPAPPANGRQIIQSAQLALTTPANRIDEVAQQVFDVVGRENGIVNSSNVTAGSSGYAEFQLSVPSSALPVTMSALSNLRYAAVSSRTDTTQDVNGEYVADKRKLADDRALRTSLLKQLANATTQERVSSLKAQIRDAEASISSDEATLRGLQRRVNSSQITVTINSGAVPVTGGAGFTIGKAAHDAAHVLTVAAGVALIVLAVLVPLALLAGLGWWIGSAVRRRRREQALDLA